MQPTAAIVLPEDVDATASSCRRALEPSVDADSDRPAGELEWSCRATLAPCPGGPSLLRGSTSRRARPDFRFSGQADASLPIPELLDALEGRASLLAVVCATAPPGARGTHDWGMPDAKGFAALACDEMLVHTSDIAGGLGVPFDSSRDICALRARASLPLGAARRRFVGGAWLGERSLGAGGAGAAGLELGVPPLSARPVGRSRPQHVSVGPSSDVITAAPCSRACGTQRRRSDLETQKGRPVGRPFTCSPGVRPGWSPGCRSAATVRLHACR